MPENGTFTTIVLFFGMISTLSPEVCIETSMMLSEMYVIVYYKVSGPSNYLGTSIFIVK